MTMRNLFVRVDKNSQSPARRGNQAAGQQQWLRHAATATMPELFRELNSSEEGLAAEQVDAAREFYGANAVAQATKRPLPLRLLAAFADPFTYILVFIAAVSVLTDWIFATGADRDLSTPLIIGTMVLVSGVLRFIQDEKSTVAAEALAEMVESCAEVERDGDGGNETPIDEIVIGDVVHLSSGDVVPADLRIFSARDLFVSQASLTGESEPVEKRASLAADASATAAASAPALTDLGSLAFMGSTVISGNARGIVVATGARTMFGEATDTLAGRKRETSFDAGIKSTSRLLMRLMLAMLPVVFVVSGATKGDWVSALLFSLSVAVGLTPEMLPMLVTTCLGKGAVDLSRHHVIVKRLDAIQDLGAIDVLCTDKTGTLTEDRIVLERHLDVNGREDARVLRYAFLNSYFSTGVKNLIDNAIVERALAEGTDEVNATVGSTTTAEELAERYHGIDELPFDFERRRLSVVVGDAAGHTRMVTKERSRRFSPSARASRSMARCSHSLTSCAPRSCAEARPWPMRACACSAWRARTSPPAPPRSRSQTSATWCSSATSPSSTRPRRARPQPSVRSRSTAWPRRCLPETRRAWPPTSAAPSASTPSTCSPAWTSRR